MLEIDFVEENCPAQQSKVIEAAAAVYEYLCLKGDIIAELDFFSEQEIRSLNRTSRGIDGATDVLSFPMLNLNAHNYQTFDKQNYPYEIAYGRYVMLGSVVICPEIMRKNAAEYGHGEQREFFYLFVHGLLHLLGFNHIKDCDKEIMRKAEEEVLARLGLSIDENNDGLRITND